MIPEVKSNERFMTGCKKLQLSQEPCIVYITELKDMRNHILWALKRIFLHFELMSRQNKKKEHTYLVHLPFPLFYSFKHTESTKNTIYVP